MKGMYFRALFLGICALAPAQLSAGTTVETASLELAFNDQGSLVRAIARYPSNSARKVELRHEMGIISFEPGKAGVWVQRRGLLDAPDRGRQQLHFTGPGGQSITWIIPERGYRIEATAARTGALVLRAGADFLPPPAAGFGSWLERVRYVAVGEAGFRQTGLDEGQPGRVLSDWAGFRNRFWTVLASGREESEFDLLTGTHDIEVRLGRRLNSAGERFSFYLGPVEPGELTAVDPLLGELLYAGLWFWLRWMCLGLHQLLDWIHAFVPSWGAAVMILSLAVHILMLPLSRIADRVQQRVHATEARLAPELSLIKQSSCGEEQAARIMALYRREGVSPFYSLKSLLGVAIVIPVFIAAFDMLAENVHLLDTGFLWINDLSRPDAIWQLPFSLPFFGSDLNLLPFLMTGLSLLASLLHRPRELSRESQRRQARNMSLLALAFFALFYTFPAGMVLYWASNNLISVVKGIWMRRHNTAGTGAGHNE